MAIVSSASLHHPDQDDFAPTDTGYRVLEAGRRDYMCGHWSPNFDATGIALDINTVFPIDRLDELAAEEHDRQGVRHPYVLRRQSVRPLGQSEWTPVRQGRSCCEITRWTSFCSHPSDRCARVP